MLGLLALTAAACEARERSLLVPGLADGTRLRARVWDGGDDARIFRTWFDTELGVECQFAMAADGRYRCLPSGSSAIWLDPVVFSDAACTRPAVIVPSCEPAPAYVHGPRIATPTCDEPEGLPVLALGPLRGTPRYYRQLGAGCTALEAAAEQQVHDVGDEVPAASFVPAQLRVPEGAARVSPYVFVGEDGAQEAVSSWDREHDRECTWFAAADRFLCRPVEVVLHYDWIWADAGCSVHAAVDLVSVRPCAPPTAVIGAGDGPYFESYLEVGAEVPRSQVFNDEQGTCSPETSELPDTYYLEGAPIPASSLPTLLHVLDGVGRLRAERFTDEQGNPLAVATRLHDSEAGQACVLATFVDGLRCLPDPGYATLGPLFADPTCTTPLALWGGTTAPLVAVQPHTLANACDRVAYEAAYAIASPFTGATIYFARPEGCIASPIDPLSTYFTVGEREELPRIVAR